MLCRTGKQQQTFASYSIAFTPRTRTNYHLKSIICSITGRNLFRRLILTLSLTLTRDIDIAISSVRPSVRLSVRLSVRHVPVWKRLNIVILSSPHGSPIILVLWVSNIFAKFRRGHPFRGRKIQVWYTNLAIFDQ